jgi:hypothetical protein
MSMKNSSDTIGNQTRNLSACSAVPQLNAPPRAPALIVPFLLCLGALSGLFLAGLRSVYVYAFQFYPLRAACPAHQMYIYFTTPVGYHILRITITCNSYCFIYTFLSKFRSYTAKTAVTFEQCPQHLFQNMF